MLHDELALKSKALSDNNIPHVIATVVRAQSPTAGRPGDKAIVTNDGEIFGWIGGGCAQPAVIKTAKKAIENNQPSLIRVGPDNRVEVEDGVTPFRSSCPSGGTLDIFLEPVMRLPVLWVLGASPVAVKLARLACVADFDVNIATPLGEAGQFACDAHFQSDWTFTSEQLEQADYVIVATQGKGDKQALEAALSLSPKFLGFVASAKKATAIKNALVDKGFDQMVIDSIVSPVGFALGGNSPADIAIAILAQLSEFKNFHPSCDGSAGCASKPAKSTATLKTKQSDEKTVAKPTGGGCCGS